MFLTRGYCFKELYWLRKSHSSAKKKDFFKLTVLEKFLELGGEIWQFFRSGAETFKNEIFLKNSTSKCIPIAISDITKSQIWNSGFGDNVVMFMPDMVIGMHFWGWFFSKRLHFWTFQHLTWKIAKSPLLTPKTFRERSIWKNLFLRNYEISPGSASNLDHLGPKFLGTLPPPTTGGLGLSHFSK